MRRLLTKGPKAVRLLASLGRNIAKTSEERGPLVHRSLRAPRDMGHSRVGGSHFTLQARSKPGR